MKRLEGNVAIVTGAGTGIGRETARRLAGGRTVIEEMVMSPTILRDQSRDLDFNRNLGDPRSAR